MKRERMGEPAHAKREKKVFALVPEAKKRNRAVSHARSYQKERKRRIKNDHEEEK